MSNNVANSLTCERCGEKFKPRSNFAKWCDSCCTYICEWCNQTFVSRRNRKVRFCSLECTNEWQNTPEAKKRAHQRTLTKLGRGEVRRCFTCDKTFYVPGWVIDRDGGKYCSRICRRISLHLICPICGKQFTRPPSCLRKVNYCSNECSKKGYIERLAAGEFFRQATTLEIAGAKLLKSLDIPYLEQQAIGGKFVVDVLFPKYDLVIQWDGDFWHGHPDRPGNLTPIQIQNQQRDKKCNIYLRKCGYQVLRFWESDVHSRSTWVLSEVRRALASSDNT